MMGKIMEAHKCYTNLIKVSYKYNITGACRTPEILLSKLYPRELLLWDNYYLLYFQEVSRDKLNLMN